MKAAIDIDGTLAKWPMILGALSRALKKDGWSVVLLTGALHPDPEKADRAGMLRGRQRQVEPFGAAFDEIVVCAGRTTLQVAWQKAEYCRQHGIDLCIDDSREYTNEIRHLSPKTLALEVR